MSYEVDVRAVGAESKSGDAIALRFGDFSSASTQSVVVIDGGYSADGEDLVSHIRHCYNTSRVDVVISTHPDNDHVSGLRAVLEELDVEYLLIHRPWMVSEPAKQILKSARMTNSSAWSYIQKSLAAAQDLEELANRKGIKIAEPFAGATVFNRIHVIGPTQAYYQTLLPQFGEATQRSSLFSGLQKAMNRIRETWNEDTLVEPGDNEVSAVNNSSVILYADLGEKHFVFTADAGVQAMTGAVQFATANGIDIQKASYIQAPHHGSKRNVGPPLLDYLIGPKVPRGQVTGKHVFISAAKEGEPKHPSKRVTNAIMRRGATVAPTKGVHHCFRSLDLPIREGWGPIEHMPFFEEHDEEE